jgi:serine/threonine-protein kinase RsbT
MVPPGQAVAITCDRDIVVARQLGRGIALELGFSGVEAALVATAISELARNIVSYAGSGTVTLVPLSQGARVGVAIIAEDQGPGIIDCEVALRDGYSSSGGLGLGLPGVRRLMDEFELHSAPGRGTSVTARRWRL